MNVKTTFLNGVIEEEVYIEKPVRHMIKRLVCADSRENFMVSNKHLMLGTRV